MLAAVLGLSDPTEDAIQTAIETKSNKLKLETDYIQHIIIIEIGLTNYDGKENHTNDTHNDHHL